MLALRADDAREPPDGGVIEEERFDEALKEVDEVVVPPDVGQLVGEQCVEVLWG
jgi:hypothetical protein